jgi:hypothetical protein
MGSILRFLSAAALLGLTTIALAYPNFNATTGIIGVPNGIIQENGTFIGAADIVFIEDTLINARVVYGLTDNLEVGAVLNLGDDFAFGLSGKYRLPVTPTAGAWAIGLSFADTDEGGSGFQAFIVASRSLTGDMTNLDLLGTLGATFTDFEGTSGFRPFVGAQLMLPNDFEIGGEFELEMGDFTESIISIVVRRQFSPTIGAEIGFTNASAFFGTSDHDLFLGINIALPPPG